MWIRKELKSNAKNVLQRNYWVAFLVCLIVMLLSGDFGNSNNSNEVVYNMDGFDINTSVQALSSFFPFKLPFVTSSFVITFLGILIPIIILISFLFFIFVINPLTVGKKRYFVESIEDTSSIGTMFKIFKDENYMNIVKIMFLMDVKLFLWTLCFIVPGIVKTYEYYMVPFLLAQDSSLSTSDVFDRSKAMTDNNKFNIFVLELSFLGWYILCAFTFGIGYLFLAPYREATYAELYYASKHLAENY